MTFEWWKKQGRAFPERSGKRANAQFVARAINRTNIFPNAIALTNMQKTVFHFTKR